MASSCWQVSFFPDCPPGETFEEFLNDYFEINAQNYRDDGQDEYVGYQSGRFDEHHMIETAAQYGLTLPRYQISELTSENWLKDYVIQFPPFDVADFCIYGIHETAAPDTNKIPLQIYAATAFGSNHQTTQSCINAISELHKQGFSPKRVLDIGTGSGILSLCAARLWPKTQILASDIDDEAVIVTNGNAKTNNLSSQIEAIQSDGYQNAQISARAPYDLVLSNILANPLIAFAPDLAKNLKPNGYCILSGFIEEQTDGVVSAHAKHGLRLIKLYSSDNWRAALMQKA